MKMELNVFKDTLFDLITDHHELVLRMARIVTKAIEGNML